MEDRNMQEQTSLKAQAQENISAFLRKRSYESSDRIVSERLGVDRSTVTNWKNGKRYISLDNVLTIAKEYGVSLDEIVNNEKPIEKDSLTLLGLTEENAEYLRLYREDKVMNETVNFLLSSKGFDFMVFLGSVFCGSLNEIKEQITSLSTSFGIVRRHAILRRLLDDVMLEKFKALVNKIAELSMYDETYQFSEREKDKVRDLKRIAYFISDNDDDYLSSDEARFWVCLKETIVYSMKTNTVVLIDEYLSHVAHILSSWISEEVIDDCLYEIAKLKESDEVLYQYAEPSLDRFIEKLRTMLDEASAVRLIEQTEDDNE